MLAVVVAVVLAGGGAWWWLSARGSAEPVAAPASVPVSAPRTAALAAPAPQAASAPLSPGEQLETQVRRDQPVVESVVGQWVPQVGSKQVGTVDDGISYDDAAIWQTVLDAKARFPQAVLLRSDDYSSFKRGGFWVIVVATPFASPADANAWCEANALGRDDCFAKRLSHSEGPQGNTVPR